MKIPVDDEKRVGFGFNDYTLLPNIKVRLLIKSIVNN